MILRIEMDRGAGWEVRLERTVPPETTLAAVVADLRRYAIQYPHRAVLNGLVVAVVKP